jgi:hypothetical protein
MKVQLTRRDFSRLLGIGKAAGPALSAACSPRKLKIGHTEITWDNDSEAAVRDVSALRYYGFETFGNVRENRSANPDLQKEIGQYNLPLISADCPPGQRKVDIPTVLDLVEKGKMQGMIMMELDRSPHMPLAAGETGRIAKAYLQKPGYAFRGQAEP